MYVYVVAGIDGTVYNVFETAEDAVKYVHAICEKDRDFRSTQHTDGLGDIIHTFSFWRGEEYRIIHLWRKGVKGFIGAM